VTITFPDHGHCQFPMGHVRLAGFHFCAEKAEAHKPYCAFHCAMCYLPPRPDDSFGMQLANSAMRRIFGGRV